jgi:cell division protein FtsI (penicillin-binding protein 3)
MVIFGFSILVRVIFIQTVEGEYWREMAKNSTIRYENIDAIRGDICADDGRLLATSVPIYEIRMDLSPEVISEEVYRQGIDSLALRLSQLFGDRSKAQYLQTLNQARNNKERYFLVKRNVTYNQLQILRDFPIFRLGKYRGGRIENEHARREMPYRTMAARTIGYEAEGVYVGLEGAYRRELEGIQGKRLMQRSAGGSWVPINDENEIQPENGKDLITTINITMQDMVENALLKQLNRFEAEFGTAVLMEVSTGKIKAISNLTRQGDGNYRETYNYAVGESAEPGSTFKLASMLALLEDGKVNPDDIVHTGEGAIRYADRIMRDARDEGHGSITVKHAFEVSSNVGISQLVFNAYKDRPQQFIDRIKALKLDQPLGLEIAGEGKPWINDPKSPSWSGVTLPWMSIGYEVSLTPLQTLSLYNAVANQGQMMKPMFVEEIRQTGKTIKRFQPEAIQRSIASQSTLKLIQEMLIGVVENGTAKNIYTPLYSIAGKTGTAQVANTSQGYRNTSGKTSYRSSFVGFFPADQPAYSMIVVIHNPKGYIYTGSQVAAPVFKEVSDKIFATQLEYPQPQTTENLLAYLPSFGNANAEDVRTIYSAFDCMMIDNIQSSWTTTVASNDTVSFWEKNLIENLVPDAVGMSLKDALYVLENAGLRVRFTGRGIVRRQSLQPGVRVNPGYQIYIELN